jgi:voltage-gated potassium channel
VDKNSLRIEELFLQNYRVRVPAFCGDARWPQNLKAAGLQHELCQGVVALTDVNETNLKIAITAKLLHPNIRVICRADSHEIEKNMKSFGTDHIFDPFDTFAEHLSMAIKSPSLHLIWSWLSVDRDPPLPEPLKPTIDRPWIVCGYGRFGKAVYQRLRDAGVRCVVIEATPERTGFPPGTYVVGRGTEAATLQQAGIHQASGLVAGTDNDANNLSIIMTAREMNRDLFVVARQNFEHNLELFEATRVDVVMHPSSIIANRIQLILGTPLLAEFLQRASYQNDDWACELVSRVSGVMEENNALDVWQVAIDCQDAYAVYELIDQGVEVCLRDLLTEFHPSEAPLQAIPLLLKREYDKLVLPEHSALLAKGDRILFCGANSVRREMEWFINNVHSLARDERSDVLKWMSGLVSRFVAGTDRVADDGNRTGTV